jgi:hypothetical protein
VIGQIHKLLSLQPLFFTIIMKMMVVTAKCLNLNCVTQTDTRSGRRCVYDDTTKEMIGFNCRPCFNKIVKVVSKAWHGFLVFFLISAAHMLVILLL